MLDVGPDAHDHAQEASVPPSDPRRQEAPTAHEEHHGHLRHEHPRWSVGRVAFLAISAICIYLFAPSIAEVFSAYDRLGDVEPIWLLPAVLCALGSFACVWLVQAHRARARATGSRWSPPSWRGTRSTASRPAVGATGTALQANMLADAGFDVAYAATALTVQSVLSTAAIVALPVFALPFVALRHPGPRRPAAGVLDRHPRVPAHGRDRHRAVRRRRAAARSSAAVIAWVRCKLAPRTRSTDRTLGRRGCSKAAIASGSEIGPQWEVALGASLARWLFEYGVLVLARCAGCRPNPNPALVLLAFVVASVLGLLPFTPGGLGFVEAGLGRDAGGRRHLHRRRAGGDAGLPDAHLLAPHPTRRRRGVRVPPAAPAPGAHGRGTRDALLTADRGPLTAVRSAVRRQQAQEAEQLRLGVGAVRRFDRGAERARRAQGLAGRLHPGPRHRHRVFVEVLVLTCGPGEVPGVDQGVAAHHAAHQVLERHVAEAAG